MISWLLAAAIVGGQDSAWVSKTRFFAASDEQYVYKVDRDDIVLDFKGGSIQSGKPVDPNQSNYTGVGILIRDRKNVTIRNLKVSGYRFNFKIENCENIRIENCSASGSRSIPILRNGQPVDTFLDIRNIDIWRTYGSGFWIENSKGVVIKKSKAKGSQNGLVMVSCANSTVIENDFSFNSGWGIALGKSSENTICWNRADFVNRPWAGFWGGDSAALAVADGSCRNYIVANSLTHSGDGFFLTHRGDNFDAAAKKIELFGPSNDNVIAYNDGSWSTANAFEGTFSTGNVYFKNWANDSSAAGFWLGYSDDSLVLDNEVLENGNAGVAIEHGKLNLIQGNRIEKSKWAGIGLWASEDWKGAAKPASNNDSINNTLLGNATQYNLRGSYNPYLRDVIKDSGPLSIASAANPSTKDRKTRFDTEQLGKVNAILGMKPKDFKYYREELGPRGAGWIQCDDFAPRDFSNDLAVWRQPDPGSIEMYLRQDGVRIAAPEFAQYDPTPEDPRLVRISTRRTGDEPGEEKLIGIGLSSQDGKRKQTVKTTLRTAIWNVTWFDWNGLTYDAKEAWSRLLEGQGLATQTTRMLGGDYSGRSPFTGVPAHHFACVATSKFKFEAGRYVFSTISDDGLRVFVDGTEVISRWNHHGPTPDEASINLTEGVHEIRVEYCQESGAAVLRLDWRKI